MARPIAAVALCAVFFLAPSQAQGQGSNDNLGETAARAFAEAEAREYLTKFLNQHPPSQGMQGFGSSVMFAVQMFLAADQYLKAENDQQRFRAARQGATAYVAYTYAATPAVGIICTIIAVAIDIIEAGVASSYGEAMLAVYKEILATQVKINELRIRLGEAEARKFLAIVGDVQLAVSRMGERDQSLRLDCRDTPQDFVRLGECLSGLVEAVLLREQFAKTLTRLNDAPDSMLAWLAPGLPIKVAEGQEAGPAVRAFLKTLVKDTEAQQQQMQTVYDTFVATYRRLAVLMIFDDALGPAQRTAALEEVRHRCRLDRFKLSQDATSFIYELTLVKQDRPTGQPAGLEEWRNVSGRALALVGNYRQRRLSCPEVDEDSQLSALMKIVEARTTQKP